MTWISVEDELPECSYVLAVFRSQKGKVYNMRADGWFRDTIYSCRVIGGNFVIQSHGPYLPATHWMKIPELPEN